VVDSSGIKILAIAASVGAGHAVKGSGWASSPGSPRVVSASSASQLLTDVAFAIRSTICC
jgi:hypothetical protein